MQRETANGPTGQQGTGQVKARAEEYETGDNTGKPVEKPGSYDDRKHEDKGRVHCRDVRNAKT